MKYTAVIRTVHDYTVVVEADNKAEAMETAYLITEEDYREEESQLVSSKLYFLDEDGIKVPYSQWIDQREVKPFVPERVYFPIFKQLERPDANI